MREEVNVGGGEMRMEEVRRGEKGEKMEGMSGGCGCVWGVDGWGLWICVGFEVMRGGRR